MLKQVTDLIAEANSRLKEQEIALSIEKRGGKLSLRGRFPKRGSVAGWRQSRKTLDLPATQTGIELAEKKAHQVWEAISAATDADSLHDDIKYMVSKRVEVPLPDGDRMDGITESGEVVEVKSRPATPKDVGQLFSYLHRSEMPSGRLIAPDFRQDAIDLIRLINASDYTITAVKVSLEELSI